MSLKICFVSLNSYPILLNRNSGSAGGAEIQQVLFAKELADLGYEVSFVTYRDTANDNLINYEEGNRLIRIIQTYHKYTNEGCISKIISLWNALNLADSDIYYHHAGCPGLVALFAYIKGKRFVYHVASDGDLYKQNGLNDKFHQKILNYFDIHIAKCVIAQNEFQKNILDKKYKKESLIIENGFPIPEEKARNILKAYPPIILWVGSISKVKQPEVFLKLVESMQDLKFQMIGGSGGDDEFFDRIASKAKTLPNLDFIGFVPFHEVDDYFERASILVNTSKFEGYPNTFIQAWMHFIPVVSLNVDPNEAICRNRLGFHSKTFDNMIQNLYALIQNKDLMSQLGDNSRKYAEKEHEIKRSVEKLAELFQSI